MVWSCGSSSSHAIELNMEIFPALGTNCQVAMVVHTEWQNLAILTRLMKFTYKEQLDQNL